MKRGGYVKTDSSLFRNTRHILEKREGRRETSIHDDSPADPRQLVSGGSSDVETRKDFSTNRLKCNTRNKPCESPCTRRRAKNPVRHPVKVRHLVVLVFRNEKYGTVNSQ